jgi:outer membrane lipoprotein-sorting protein
MIQEVVDMRSRTRALAIVPVLAGLTLLGDLKHDPRVPFSKADDFWEQSRAAYAALRSYSDVGVMVTEDRSPGAPLVVERHTFTTYYRAPRQFYFDFRKDPKAGKERLVIWSDGGDFQSWWSATGVHQTYPRGTGATAFATASFPTKGAVLLVPPLLFSQAGLQGPLVALKAPRLAGTEDMDGHRVHKLVGEVALTYRTGLGGHARPTTVWIDAQTLLVRKIVEDTPAGSAQGSVDRVTTTFKPQANPPLADSLFRFAVPGARSSRVVR